MIWIFYPLFRCSVSRCSLEGESCLPLTDRLQAFNRKQIQTIWGRRWTRTSSLQEFSQSLSKRAAFHGSYPPLVQPYEAFSWGVTVPMNISLNPENRGCNCPYPGEADLVKTQTWMSSAFALKRGLQRLRWPPRLYWNAVFRGWDDLLVWSPRLNYETQSSEVEMTSAFDLRVLTMRCGLHWMTSAFLLVRGLHYVQVSFAFIVSNVDFFWEDELRIW